MWHLAHCFLKTSLPAAGVARLLRSAAAARRAPSAGRRWAGRRRVASSGWARSAICRSGWAARACFWSSDRSASCSLPLLDRVEQRRGPVGAAEQHAQGGRPDGGRQLRQPIGQRPRRRRATRCWPSASTRPRGQLGRGAGRDQVEQLARPAESFLRQLDELRRRRRCAPRRPASLLLASARKLGGHRGDLLAEALAAPARGQRDELRLGRRRAACRTASASDCSSSGVSVELAVARPAAGQAARGSAAATSGCAVCSAASSGRGFAESAAGDVLGDDGDALGRGCAGECLVGRLRRRPSGTAASWPAAAAVDGVEQRCGRSGRPVGQRGDRRDAAAARAARA